MYDVTADLSDDKVVKNGFTDIMRQSCKSLGENLQVWGIYKEGVSIDFANFEGLVDKNKKLVKEIAEYVGNSIGLDADNIVNHKALFLDYLASIGICYVEVPKFITKNGSPQHTYDKFMCTKNPKIIQAILKEKGVDGSDLETIQNKYAVQLAPSDNDDFWCVRINTSGKTVVTKPIKAYDASKIKLTPVFMLSEYMQGLKDHMNKEILEFTYLKDNDTERVLVTTTSRQIIEKFYNNRQFIESVLMGINFTGKLNRGYIKVPELGSSIYDTGLRSLNIARILNIRKLEEKDVDTTFINVDLESVMENFGNQIDYVALHNPDELPEVYKELTGEDLEDKELVSAQIVEKIKQYATSRSIMLSTTFHRQLHLFLVRNPFWFPLYTGTRKAPSTSGISVPTGIYL